MYYFNSIKPTEKPLTDVELEAVLSQLYDLILDRESFQDLNDPECAFTKDILAIETLLADYKRLKTKEEQDNG